jgi:transcriptional regulator with XRE-family HTH domain
MKIEIGKTIKDLRKSKGITATFVAEKIGVTSSVLSEIERGKSNPTIDKVVALSDFFGVTTDYLLKGANDENSSRAVA